MSVLTVCGVGILFAISFYLLSSLGAKSAPLYLALGATFLLALVSEPYFEAVHLIFSFPRDGVTSEVAKTVSKALSLGYLVGISADLCEQFGASALAKAMVFGGRILIFTLGIPYLKSLVSLASTWLSL